MVAKVSKWNQYAKVSQDLYGIGDVLAVKGPLTVLVQATTQSNAAARLMKALAEERLWKWLEGGNRAFHIHGWAKRGAAGKRKLWTVSRRAVRDDQTVVLLNDEEDV